MSLPIIPTKLYFPPARFNIVSRPRLLKKLEKGLTVPLTLISAPVGYGKTTLMSEWHAGDAPGFPAAWLSIDGQDNDPERFLTYLAAALESVQPGVAADTSALLHSPPLAPMDAVLAALINDLHRFEQELVLALDDYQFITNATIHDALSFLLDHCPHNFHLVLITRADPPFPLARLRVRQQLVEIRGADLRFNSDETADFLTDVMKVNLSAEDLRVLETQTEGWAAGLQLAALSIQDSQDLSSYQEKFSGSHHYVVDYMIEEVLNRQPEDLKNFLLKTSVLERMNSAVCAALTQRADSQAMLERLEQLNLFLVPLDASRRWYRYHHFFRDLLRNRLQRAQPQMIPDLHLQASTWYRENGFLSEALEHAVAGRHYQEAAALIEGEGNGMLANGAWGALLNWVSILPEEITRRRPLLNVFYIWGHVLSSRLEEVDGRLQDIETAIDEGGLTSADQKVLAWHLQAIRGRVAYLSGDFQQAVALTSEALDSLDAQEMTFRSVLGITLGSSYFLAGERSAASRVLKETRKISQQAGNLVYAIDAAGALAQIQEAEGNLRAAAATYQDIIRLSENRIDPNRMAAHLNLGNVFYEWNQLDEADENYHACLEISQKIHAPDGNLFALLGSAKTRRAMGDAAGEADRVRKAEQFLPNFSQSILGEYAEAILAQLALARGDLAAAENWAAQRSLPDDESLIANIFMQKVEYLTLARLHILRGQAADAEKFLEKLYAAAETAGVFNCQIEALALIAFARSRQKNRAGALEVLTQALELARPSGYIRIFIDLGEPIKQLIYEAAAQGDLNEFVQDILPATHTPGTGKPPPGSQPVEPLTERELEVLKLLVLGKTNKQIAQDLFLATGTVKKHLNNIYGKLGVNNRTECARRATELKLTH